MKFSLIQAFFLTRRSIFTLANSLLVISALHFVPVHLERQTLFTELLAFSQRIFFYLGNRKHCWANMKRAYSHKNQHHNQVIFEQYQKIQKTIVL